VVIATSVQNLVIRLAENLVKFSRELGQQVIPYRRPVRALQGPLASFSAIESRRQPPDLCREPGGEIWPPRDDIGAGSTAGNRSDIARVRSCSSRHGSGEEKTIST
jgi:hypothetical protein